eukprot:UN26452
MESLLRNTEQDKNIDDYNELIKVAIESRDKAALGRLIKSVVMNNATQPNKETFCLLIPHINDVLDFDASMISDVFSDAIIENQDPSDEMYNGIMQKLQKEGNLENIIELIENIQTSNRTVSPFQMSTFMHTFLNTSGYQILKLYNPTERFRNRDTRTDNEKLIDTLLANFKRIETKDSADSLIQACLQEDESQLALQLYNKLKDKYEVTPAMLEKWILYNDWEDFQELKLQIEPYLTKREKGYSEPFTDISTINKMAK